MSRKPRISFEIKIKYVQNYLAGKISISDVCKKYNISSDSVFRRWIKMYNNSHKQCKTLNIKENKFMTKGRKTTYDERIEIVAFCIENNDNYQLTSDKYKVSYQQVYSWVRKYKTYGQDSLIDNRSKSKTFNDMI